MRSRGSAATPGTSSEEHPHIAELMRLQFRPLLRGAPALAMTWRELGGTLSASN